MTNTLMGGSNNQTVSARQWKRKMEGKVNVCFLIDAFFWWEPDHCEDSWNKWNVIRNAMAYYEEYREKYSDFVEDLPTNEDPLTWYYRSMGS